MSIKIAILVKQVPDHEALIEVKSEEELDIENRYVCSFFDEIAIETGLNIKKTSPDTELMALSAGGRRAVEALRRAVAMGVDKVEHIGDESLDEADSFTVASALAARLRILEPDIILCGKQAGDDDQAAVGPMVAELCGMSFACAVVSLEPDSGNSLVRVERKLEGDTQALEAKFPVLLSAEKGLAEPHVPVVTRVMKAMKAKIENFPLADLDVSGQNVIGRRRLRFHPPPERPPVTMVEDIDALVDKLQQAGFAAQGEG